MYIQYMHIFIEFCDVVFLFCSIPVLLPYFVNTYMKILHGVVLSLLEWKAVLC
jgi:hypothetical protein